jgi:hypothetical protein
MRPDNESPKDLQGFQYWEADAGISPRLLIAAIAGDAKWD